MGTTTIRCTDTTILLTTLDTASYDCSMSLDELTRCIVHGLDDPARVILFMRHYPKMPVYLKGVTR